VTVHAETHRHIDVSLRNALRADVAVARRALDFGSNVRCVIEPDVRLRGIPEHPLPGEVASLLAHLSDLPDAGSIRGDGSMTRHTRPHTGQTGNRPFRDRLMTVLGARDIPADVDVMRELERLLDLHRMPTEEVIERGRKRRVRRGIDVRSLPGQQLYGGRTGHIPFEKTAADAAGQRYEQNETDARECGRPTDEGDPHRKSLRRHGLWSHAANEVDDVPHVPIR
jgi:hypothetical protein